jgi:hypothetical protein
MHRHLLALSLVVSVTVSSVNAYAQWQPSGFPVCTAVHDQLPATLAPDGSGGAFITWSDYRTGVFGDIYAQRLNAFGLPQWTANGVAVCTAADDQSAPVVVPDAGTGAIIVWYDKRNGVDTDIYAQRLNASGVPQWTANGVTLCSAVGDQVYPDVIPDGSGGAIIVWEDHRAPGLDFNIYVQRVNASGVAQWTANGVAVCSAANNQTLPHLKSDGAGGAIMAWTDGRNATLDIFAQRVNAAGLVQWIGNGVALCTEPTGGQYSVQLAADGAGGAVVVWQDDRNGFDSDIFAQRVNASGAVLWDADGVAVCTATNFQSGPQIVADGSGGAIMAWIDVRDAGPDDIYAQRVGASGQAQWKLHGIPIAVTGGYQTNPVMASDGAGGAVLAWQGHAQRNQHRPLRTARERVWGRPVDSERRPVHGVPRELWRSPNRMGRERCHHGELRLSQLGLGYFRPARRGPLRILGTPGTPHHVGRRCAQGSGRPCRRQLDGEPARRHQSAHGRLLHGVARGEHGSLRRRCVAGFA